MPPHPLETDRPDSTATRPTGGAAPGQFPRWIWAVYLVLFVASVPWYVPAGAPLRLWFGLPHWVVLSLAATFGVALFTAFVVHFLWPAQEPPEA